MLKAMVSTGYGFLAAYFIMHQHHEGRIGKRTAYWLFVLAVAAFVLAAVLFELW